MDDDKKSKKLVSSSMVDLKAELYRKQEEFKRQKEAKNAFIKAKKPEKKGGFWSKQNSGVTARAQRDLDTRERDEEEEEALAKSRRILEQKSKVYDSFTNSSSIPEEDGSEYYLVDFQKKAIDALVEERETKRCVKEEEEEERAEREALAQEIPEASCPEDEWVDFTDSLGRERRCMKKDLNQLIEKDRLLALAQTKKGKKSDTQEKGALKGVSRPDKNTLEEMRRKWEVEAQQLIERGQDEIHYSNVQFDEVRAHGVGFFQFSKDHTKREEELEQLHKLRDETKEERARKDRIKDKRKTMLEARLAKVRQRRKLKEEVPEPATDENKTEDNVIGPKLEEAASETSAQENREMEEMEAAEDERKNHVREWDKEKLTGKAWTTSNYVAARREERENEFAPPSVYFDRQPNKSMKSKATSAKPHQDLWRPKMGAGETTEASTGVVGQPGTGKDLGHLPEDSSNGSCVGQDAQTSKSNTGSDLRYGQLDSPIAQTASSHVSHMSVHGPPTTQHKNVDHWSSQTSPAQSYWTPGGHMNNQVTGQWTETGQWNQAGLPCSMTPHWNTSVQPNPATEHWSNVEQNISASGHSRPCGPPGMAANVPNPAIKSWSHDQQTNSSIGHWTQAAPCTPASGQQTTWLASSQSSGQFYQEQASPANKTLPLSRPTNSEDQDSLQWKTKVPKLDIIDTRFVNNFDTSSINPEPGRVPDVVGVPYVPGTFSKYNPRGQSSVATTDSEKEEEHGSMQNSTGAAQISGGPLIYTKEQLDRQRQDLDQPVEESNIDTDKDRMVQDFLSSIRKETS